MKSFFVYRSPAHNAPQKSDRPFFGKEGGAFFPAKEGEEATDKSFFSRAEQQNNISNSNVVQRQAAPASQEMPSVAGDMGPKEKEAENTDLGLRHIIQREEEQDRPSTTVLVISLGAPGDYEARVAVRNNRDLAAAYGAIESALFFDRDEFMPDDDNNSQWDTWRTYKNDAAPTMTQWYDAKNPDEIPIPEEIAHFRNFLGNVRRMARRAHGAYLEKDRVFKERLGQERRRLEDARAKAQQGLRMQFLGGGEADETSGFLWTMIDHLGTFSGELTGAMQVPYTVAIAGKVIPGAITVANVVVNWQQNTPATTGTAFEGLAPLNNIVSLGGAANSFFVNPAYILTAYIGPMLSAITILLGRLQMQLIENNDEATAVLHHPLYIGAEPGGREMWNYMVEAMHASSRFEIAPPSGNVYDYFDDYSDRFDDFNSNKAQSEQQSGSATGNAETIPTESSWLIFSQLDAESFPGWLYSNRETVWTLLYGSRDAEQAQTIE